MLKSRIALALILCSIAASSQAADNVIISEFMAKNETKLADQDGEFEDWIEIYNAGPTPVDLNGMYLTDDVANLTLWQFPVTNLNANTYLVVFASEKNRRVSGSQLHTNFKLDSDGGYLALVQPDGTTKAFEYLGYPDQTGNISYGVAADLVTRQYFANSTPGTANVSGAEAVAAKPVYPRPGGAYPGPNFTFSITSPSPAAQIRYTNNGTEPTAASSLYSSPITITGTTLIKAKCFQAGLANSETVSVTYIVTDANTRSFNSNIPIIVLNSFGSVPNEGGYTNVSAHVIDTSAGRAYMDAHPDYSGRAALEIRGSSSTQFPKKSYKFELRNDFGTDRKHALLGMPEDSDFVLYAPFTDKSLMRDAFTYDLGRKIGILAPRLKFVELFLNTSNGGQLTNSDYLGVYVLLEKIKRGAERVNIQELLPTDLTEPNISGGYILKKDRLDAGDSGVSTNSGQVLGYVDPKEPLTPQAQRTWIRNWLNQYEAALYGGNFADPINGYANYIDVNSFILNHMMVELCKNIDGYRLSQYFYKDRNGKLVNGPLWDYNLSLGNANYLNGGYPQGWYWSLIGSNEYIWYGRLFQDPEFTIKWQDTWARLRKDQLKFSTMQATTDAWKAMLGEATVRNYQRWNILQQYWWPNVDFKYTGGSWQGYTYDDEYGYMRDFLHDRVAWMDAQYPSVPLFSQDGGAIAAGFNLALSFNAVPEIYRVNIPQGLAGTQIALPPTGTIYYTLDGSDPRLTGGGISPQAIQYTGGITLNNNTRVRARSRTSGNVWSGLNEATFTVTTPRLVVTEIMYHPYNAPDSSQYNDEDFEYIELRNTGSAPIALAGAKISGNVDFTFTSGTLNVGEYLVLASNAAAFQSRYGFTAAGTYTGYLSNSGGRLVVTGPKGEPILDFEYKDSWYPITDGSGFSLVILNDAAEFTTWGLKESWRASAVYNGSATQADPIPPVIAPIVVNELMSHPLTPGNDAIELFNPTEEAVDVGGWYITDDKSKAKKYKIPPGTTIDENSTLNVPQSAFGAGADGFTFSLEGEDAYLFSANAAGVLTGYMHGFSFEGADKGVSFGRYLNSVNDEQFPAQLNATMPGSNSGPRVGPVVIGEIMYAPLASKDEYIELVNLMPEPIKLYDPSNPANTWKLSGADYSFPPNSEIAGNGILIVTNLDPTYFRTKYSVPGNVQIFGPFDGGLQSNGELLALKKPDTPVLEDDGTTAVPYIVVDAVRYDSVAPWPTQPGTLGYSLERYDLTAYGNDPINWRASNGPGGSLGVFYGPNPPSPPSALVVTAVAPLMMNLQWSDTPDTELGYRVERCLDGVNNWIFAGTTPSGTLSFQDSGLVAGQPYFYRVSAYNRSGFSQFSNVAADVASDGVPLPPGNVSALATAADKIRVAWQASFTTETGFYVERSTDGVNNWVQAGETDAVTLFYVDTGLISFYKYYYRVRGFSEYGVSNPSPVASATTLDGIPGTPGNLNAAATASNRIVLTWADLSANENQFKLERSLNGTTFAPLVSVSANVTTYTDSTVWSASTFYYRISASNAYGTSAPSQPASTTTPDGVPGTPLNLTLVAVSVDHADISWTDVSPNETGFKIERNDGSPAGWQPLIQVAADMSTYSDTTVYSKKTYFYRVSALNEFGSSAPSNTVKAVTPDGVPAPPLNVVAEAVSATQINLFWVDNSTNETSFIIERSLNGSSDWETVQMVFGDVTTYTDATAWSLTTFYYRIKAQNSFGASQPSVVVAVTTVDGVPGSPRHLTATALNDSQIRLTWEDVSVNESGFIIERSTDGINWLSLPTIAANTVARTDSGLRPNTIYNYRIHAWNAFGVSEALEIAQTSTLPLPDIDNDNYPDIQEQALGTNPNNPDSKPGGTADFDNDGAKDDADSDDDNDLINDDEEYAAGTNPYDANSGTKKPMTVTALSGAVVFTAPNKDSLALGGTITPIPTGTSLADSNVIVDLAGVVLTFKLNAKGQAKVGNTSIAVALKPTKGSATLTATFKVSGKSGNYATFWADEGIVNADKKNAPVTMKTNMRLLTSVYTATTGCFYTAKTGKSGKFKK